MMENVIKDCIQTYKIA